MTNKIKKCWCGQNLHYKDKKTEKMVQDLVDKLGEFIPVSRGTRTFLVQRHYIALHGITPKTDLEKLGFKEIKSG